MGVSKVVFGTENGAETLIDLTSDTVTAETLAEGVTAHDASGEEITGTMATSAVLYTEQSLTEAQQAQARENISALRFVQQTSEPSDTSVLWIDPSDNTGNGTAESEESLYQYIFKSNITDGYFWWFDSAVTTPYKYAYDNYSVVEPITLEAGTYYLSSLITHYTWIKVGDGAIQRIDNYADLDTDNTTSGDFVLTIAETSTIWLAYYNTTQVTDTTPYLVNGTSPLKAGEYFEGKYSLSLENLFNYDIFDLAYIKHGELVINNRNISTGLQGDYTGVKMGANVQKLMCKARFPSNSYAKVALVTTNYGSSLISDITKGSIHLVFGNNHCSVGFYKTVDQLTEVRGISYTVQENAEVSFGFEIDEDTNTLTVYLPNGTTQTITDTYVSTLNGQYAIWEFFINTEAAGEFAHSRITKLWCKDLNGEILNDDLKRFDGAIGVAPTGQPYRQFHSNYNDFE